MNPVLLFIYNTTPEQLKLSQLCIESILLQTIPVYLLIVNNGSTPETAQWLAGLTAPAPHVIEIRHHLHNTAPTIIANRECATFFALDAEYVLGVPSDAILPPYCYEQLLKCSSRGFIAAYMHSPEPPRVPESLAEFTPPAIPPPVHVLHSNMHTALMLTRRWAFDALIAQDGYFLDEGMFLYACDLDLKARLEIVGISGAQTDLAVYHYSSACWRLATPEISRAISIQADRDRAYFAQKWNPA